jgi:hypothetical protein
VRVKDEEGCVASVRAVQSIATVTNSIISAWQFHIALLPAGYAERLAREGFMKPLSIRTFPISTLAFELQQIVEGFKNASIWQSRH